MAKAMVTVKVMPEAVDVDLDGVTRDVKEAIVSVCGDVGEIRVEDEPIAFGLRALKFTFIIDESIGTDAIEQKISSLKGVANVQIVDFRRTLG